MCVCVVVVDDDDLFSLVERWWVQFGGEGMGMLERPPRSIEPLDDDDGGGGGANVPLETVPSCLSSCVCDHAVRSINCVSVRSLPEKPRLRASPAKRLCPVPRALACRCAQ